MKRITTLLACALIGFVSSAHAEVDVKAGEKKAQICAACHGAAGHSTNAAFPILAGQHADYLVVTLKAYRNGSRKNPIMQGQAAQLTDQEIKDLAAYFAVQPGPLTVKK